MGWYYHFFGFPGHVEGGVVDGVDDDTFEGFQLMRDKGPFIRESLAALKHTIDLALADYPRVLAFRLDLYVPKKIREIQSFCAVG